MWRKPLAAFLMIVAARSLASAQNQRTVHLHTTDDITIAGTYYPAKTNPAPAVLLIHSVARNRTTWDSFARLLQQSGMAALAIDLRGHGESTHKLTADGSVAVDFHNFAGNDYQDMLLDVEAAVDWLQAEPETDRKHIALIGESLGANLALRYAAINEDIAAIVVFSPGINYRDVRTDDVISQVGHKPLHIYVSQFDSFAFESSKRLIELQKEADIGTATNELTICTGNLHGSNMLLGVKNLPQIVMNWLKEAFGQGMAPPAASTPAVPFPQDDQSAEMIPLRDDRPTRTFAFVTVGIIILNALVFGHELSLGNAERVESFFATFSLTPAHLTHAPSVDSYFTIFTSMFMHGGWLHIIGNMLYLWIFGNNIEDAVGHFRFIIFYLLCGIAATATQVAISPDSTVPMIGASGAVSGVLGAYLLLLPRARVLVLFPIWIFWRTFYVPAMLMLVLWFGMQLLSGLAVLHVDVTGGVAFWAHVGGFVAGLLLVPIFKKRGVRLFQ